MPKTIEHVKELTVPMIAVRGTVAFPGVQINLELTRPASIAAFRKANELGSPIFLVTQKDIDMDAPEASDLFRTGTVCQIKRFNRTDDGQLTVIFEGMCRAVLHEMSHDSEDCLYASVVCKTVRIEEEADEETQNHINMILALAQEIKDIHPILTDEMLKAAAKIQTPGLFCDFIASSCFLNFKNKQQILEAFHPDERLEAVYALLQEEIQLLTLEYEIHREVKHRIDDHQKEYYLREQIKVIQQELGDDDDEIAEYHARIQNANLPTEVKEKLEKELARLAKTPFGAAEGSVLRTYLDTCLEVPWSLTTLATPNVKSAKRILDADHDGMEKLKKRILEIVAVKQLCPTVKNQTICLVGPPGVGKTSVAASIARALKRKYARISLGGIRDEADIRGHRKTYVGAMPGRIVDAIISAGSMNPVIVLDEVDKLAHGLQGDPASALLEVLDPEQNRYFRDHFLELPLDLSDCVFIATANSYEGIPDPLLDRMEIIELSTYTRTEKAAIARNHLIPKQLEKHGLNKKTVKFTASAIQELIEFYTREAGVRNLEREIASLCRKAAMMIADGTAETVKIDAAAVEKMLGKRKFLREELELGDPVGVVNGLAYTQTGGDMLKVEVAVLEGTGKIELTGRLGDVMKESAHIAVSYVRSIAAKLGIDPTFYRTKDIHIHFPEGAVPKDGPSAGIAMTCALVSALTNTPADRTVAMTGEVSLHGKALPIGGLKEKTMAAYTAGVKTVLIPRKNECDLDEIDAEARAHLNIILCDTVEDALRIVLKGVAPSLEDASTTKSFPHTVATDIRPIVGA